jgi:hypothetical protein
MKPQLTGSYQICMNVTKWFSLESKSVKEEKGEEYH